MIEYDDGEHWPTFCRDCVEGLAWSVNNPGDEHALPEFTPRQELDELLTALMNDAIAAQTSLFLYNTIARHWST